ncbi:hypothetical protein NC652_013493 [Populus alba x Populus x berolinensis]|uniref:Uncharacterized protein n=1 Tax=Populus alba x Populus x berolinensis TaxID=444605 RepID=A0AAD6QUG7_9ROSI|nr:hypothetical protein NC652_013493 [Populus alba x Populus x berolinensis]KAJ6996861.1 hypothetical protein NC653_013445 [Populus alba x Populus x berolinensis]
MVSTDMIMHQQHAWKVTEMMMMVIMTMLLQRPWRVTMTMMQTTIMLLLPN